MVTALEIHIEINQGLQRIASNVYDQFLPEEIDWIFNKIQNRFIESNVRPDKEGNGRFEINEVALDDIQPIVILNKEIITFREKENVCYAILPPEYQYLLNDRSGVLSNCSDSFTFDTTDKLEYIGQLTFTNSTKVSSNYYSTFNIFINGETIFNIQDYDISVGLSTVNQKFVIINLVLEVLTFTGYNIYWERYRDIYKKDTFIFVSDSTMTGSITIDSVTNSLTISDNTYKIFNNTMEMESPNRLTKTNILPDVLYNNVYTKTIPRSPVSSMATDKLYVNYTEKRFIVNRVFIDYVRKPTNLSLILNKSCELPESAVRKICDLVVEYMKNLIESPGYQMKLQDNMVRMQ